MKLNKLAEKFDVKPSSDGSFRFERGGFNFQLIEGAQDFIRYNYLVVVFQNEISKDIYKSIQKENRLKLRPALFNAFNSNNGLAYFAPFKNKDELHEFIDKQIELYKQFNLEPIVNDVMGKDIADGYRPFDLTLRNLITLRGVSLPVNLSSFKEMIAKEEEEIKQELSNVKNYPKALLMAIVGALLGSLPAVILYSVGYMVVAVYALIPFAAFYFYKKATAPTNTFTIIYIGIIGLIFAVLTSLFGMFTIASYFEIPFEMLFTDSEISKDLMTDIILTILFYGIGFVFTAIYIYRQTSSKRIKDIKRINN